LERFTRSARAAVQRAREEARELHHPSVRTAHLLLAMVDAGDEPMGRLLLGLGLDAEGVRADVRRIVAESQPFTDADATALASVGIDLDRVRSAVEEAFGPGALDRDPSLGRVRMNRVAFAPESKKALELAVREAIRLRQASIGSEHLLLGLVRDERSSAARLLAARGIDAANVRAEVERSMADGEPPGRTA
jgi:ATP-dependent Clp protease ATP-binding subunit ClpA